MPRSLLFGVLTAAFLTARCTSYSEKKAVLTDDQVTRVLAELAIADGATLGLAGYAKDTMALRYYNQVFAITGVRKEDFAQSIDALSDDPKRLKAIMERAEALLESGSDIAPGNKSE
jgi:hypothetical protein